MPTENGTQGFEAVIGLEVHAQLATASKLFCGDDASYGSSPNTHISAVSLAHPGTLPRTNREAVLFSVRMGLACECSITRENYFARKHYFYPDLPKGYQVSQHTAPICTRGRVRINTGSGLKDIALNRIHLEEDAGKSIHDRYPELSAIDHNRAGVALIEIVTEPVIGSAEEAALFLAEVRRTVRWLGICDGNMEEGSLRCDANISLRPAGSSTLGTKVEIKNLNSIRFLKKAVEAEIRRQTGILAGGGKVSQETRSFQPETGLTTAIREKEEANDYRYFPEPDLTPFFITGEMLSEIRNDMPALPDVLQEDLVKNFGLSGYDAAQLVQERGTADYFLKAAACTNEYKTLVNLILGPLRRHMNETGEAARNFPVPADKLAALVNSGHDQDLSPAKLNALLQQLIEDPLLDLHGTAPEAGADEDLEKWVDQVLLALPDKVAEYRRGKKNLLGMFMGHIKKQSGGKADPARTNQVLLKKLEAS